MKIEYDHPGVVQLDEFGAFSFDTPKYFPDLMEGEVRTIHYRVVEDDGEVGQWLPLFRVHGTKGR